MSKAMWQALISAVGLVAANLVTAFGPVVLSWGQKPIYSGSAIYRDLRRENPLLEKTLSEQLLQRTLYYTYRRTEVTFKRLEGNDVVIEVRNISKVRNAIAESQDYSHTVVFNDTVTYDCVTFRPQGGLAITYDKKRLRTLDPGGNPLRSTYKLPRLTVGPHGSLEIESQYTIIKPNRKNETALVTSRFINAPMTFLIRNEIRNPKFRYAVASLAFDSDLPEEDDPMKPEKTITIPGPVFSGQGISINWDTN